MNTQQQTLEHLNIHSFGEEWNTTTREKIQNSKIPTAEDLINELNNL